MWQTSNLIWFALHCCVSTAITIHILLHKRNVHSAVGWIGLAWLSPFVGAVLYISFGINRVQRRARILRRSTATKHINVGRGVLSKDPYANLKTTIGALTGRDLVGANISLPMHNGDGAYPQMLKAIKNAEKTIALTSYIFRSDKIGHEFIDALAKARQRGVEVRALIDGFGSGMFLATTYRLFRSKGIPAARFMSLSLPWKIDRKSTRLNSSHRH